MHFLRPRLANCLHYPLHRSSPYDAVVNKGNALSCNKRGDYVELELHHCLSPLASRHDERPVHVTVFLQRLYELNSGCPRVAHCRAPARVWNRHHDVNIVFQGWIQFSKFLPQPFAHPNHALALDHAVGPRDVNPLEHAMCSALFRRDHFFGHLAVLRNHQHFAGLHIARKLSAKRVQHRGFACNYPRAIAFAKAKGPKAVAVAQDYNVALLGEHEKAISPVHLVHHCRAGVEIIPSGKQLAFKQVAEALRVGGGVKSVPVLLKLLAQRMVVDEVAVKADCKLACLRLNNEGLGVFNCA